jgi:hypothetical protein
MEGPRVGQINDVGDNGTAFFSYTLGHSGKGLSVLVEQHKSGPSFSKDLSACLPYPLSCPGYQRSVAAQIHTIHPFSS